jgi:hypothetical protein
MIEFAECEVWNFPGLTKKDFFHAYLPSAGKAGAYL